MKKYFLTTIFIILFVGIGSVQFFYDSERSKASYTEPLVLDAKIVRSSDLGLHNAAADIAWLSAIQYFGGGESAKSEKLPDYLFLASDLDPKFAYPYAFGALILPSIGQADLGLSLAQRGLNNGVEDYRIPYYMATTYYLTKKDTVNAAKYFDLAANTPGAPDGIKKVVAAFGSQSDDRAKTKQIWTGIYETTNDEIVKERAKNYIMHLEILDFLDQAVARYYSLNKAYPKELNDLVIGKIVTAIPPDPFGFDFTIDGEGRIGVK